MCGLTEDIVNEKGLGKAIIMITQIALSMLAPICVGTFFGYLLYRWLDVKAPILIFLLLGIAAGYRNVWKMVKSFTKDEPDPRLQKKETHSSPAEEEFARWKTERDARKGESHGSR